MIRYADHTHIPALRELWRICFGDGEDYIRFAFGQLLAPDRVLVHLEPDGAPSAMLCVQPMELALFDGEAIPAVYIFAVATHPDHRGRGLSTKLMEAAHLLLADKGFGASVLVPAGDSLFRFYAQRGYEAFSSVRQVRVPGPGMPASDLGGAVVPAALHRLWRLREAAFGDCRAFVRWDGPYLKAITAECRLSGGEVLCYAGGGYRGYAACYRDGEGGVVIKELVIPPAARKDFLAAIHMRMRAAHYTLRLREDYGAEFTNNVLPFSMVRWYDKEKKRQALSQGGRPAHIAFALD